MAQIPASEPIRLPPSSLNADVLLSHLKNSKIMMETDILRVDPNGLGKLAIQKMPEAETLVEEWEIEYHHGRDFENLQRAAQELKETDTPVAFPTETVYGLGADATRSSAVRAIFAAKGRPADNPLIVHIHSIRQLRALLSGRRVSGLEDMDPIPDIYKPLIKRFWPGPLTIILPNPNYSILAPEVTAGLDTFGARMPRSILSLALMRLAGVPLAGPSANASTRPSPTAAEHVKDDLDGRIHTIVDGGPCEVGVESTVVDGLSHPPTILRPGGVTVEQLRQCPGWENVVVGYKDSHEQGTKPKAPGMKYRHYSPKATVVLCEVGAKIPHLEDIFGQECYYKKVGIIRSRTWPPALGLPVKGDNIATQTTSGISYTSSIANKAPPENSNPTFSNLLRSVTQHEVPHATHHILNSPTLPPISVWDIALGSSTDDVARGLFSALRELDKKDVDVIYVEGIDDKVGDDIAAAVMNRLRKAAEIKI
jgi:L-threonylcarbamoyladenylate synthase